MIPVSSWSVRLHQSPRLLDAAVALWEVAAVALIISVAHESGATQAVNAPAYMFAVVLGAVLFARRSRPMLVLVASVGLLQLYYGLNYPAFPEAVPLAAATYAAATAGLILPAAALLATFEAAGVAWQTLDEHTSLASVLGTGTLADASLLAAVLLLGEAMRHRRAWAAEVRHRIDRARADQQDEAARALQAERVRIARELHDITAHTIAALTVHAGVARDVIDDTPEQAKASLTTIRRQSREAMAELRAAIDVLREDDPDADGDAPRRPAPGLAAIDRLTAIAAPAGIAVDVETVGTPRPLPGALDLTAYRVIQEALTNVVRHARASRAWVRLEHRTGSVVVEVADDGCADPSATPASGHGLTGMRERTVALGGSFDAGPLATGGFRVRAELPLAPVPA